MNQCNVGGADRAIRFIIGAAALIAGFVLESLGWRITAFVIAGVALLTAIVRFCTFNALLGVNTCRRRIDRP
jgi:hypothetical protein